MFRLSFHWRMVTFLICVLPVISQPVHAKNPLGKILDKLPIPGRNNSQGMLSSMLTEAFGTKVSPFVLDPNRSFGRIPAGQAPTTEDFKPILLRSVSDLNRPLPPGDYSLQVMFYCTQWSVHRPGKGHPYTLGRAQGKLVKPMHAMLFRGTLKRLPPATLNAMAWRIQAGVPLSQWSDEEKALTHQLIPEYEKDLKGNWLQRVEEKYNKTLGLVTRKSFDQQLTELGDLGKTALNLKGAYNTLADQRVAPEQLSLQMFQQFNPGENPQLPDDPDHPSPWMGVSPGVMARFTPVGGYLQEDNLLNFRVTPEANGQGANGYPTLAEVLNGTGKDADTGLIGYSPDSQDPLFGPVLEEPSTPCSIVSVSANPSENVQIGVPVTFTAHRNGAQSPITWTGCGVPNGSMGDTITVIFSSSGAHTITASCDASSKSITVNVNKPDLKITTTLGFDGNKRAYIDATPAMPKITFHTQWPEGANLDNVQFKWQLTVSFLNHNRHDTFDINSETITGNGDWTPDFDTHLAGGDLRVTVTVTLPDQADCPGETLTADLPVGATNQPEYSIRGENPTSAVVNAYLTEKGYGAPVPNIICHETHYQQFNVGNSQAGWPNWGYPNGWGIMQVDLGANNAPIGHLWNWKDNVDAGLAVWDEKLNVARRFSGDRGQVRGPRFEAEVKKYRQVARPANERQFTIHIPEWSDEQITRDAIRGYNGYGSLRDSTGGLLHEYELAFQTINNQRVLQVVRINNATHEGWAVWTPVDWNRREGDVPVPNYVNEVLACQ